MACAEISRCEGGVNVSGMIAVARRGFRSRDGRVMSLAGLVVAMIALPETAADCGGNGSQRWMFLRKRA